jgi:uncharacterized protein YciW
MADVVGSETSPWQGELAAIAARTRDNIVAMSRKTEEAVTAPRDPGGFPSQWRLAMAARIAALNGLGALAGQYRAQITDAALRALAEPSAPGRDAREQTVLAFMDKVAGETRAVTAEDIEGLKAAGVAEADIVRLCELNAFMSYQARVLAGLAILKGASA